jgi:ketosteroid isomerase-like protein
MPSANLRLISDLYQNFAKGDVPAVLGVMSLKIVWNEAESNPYADGNPYIGPQAVVDGVFTRCATEWEGFSVNVNELLDAGGTVIALCRYGGVNKATGRSLNTQVVHIWRIAEGKVSAFDQRLDTLQLQRVMGLV